MSECTHTNYDLNKHDYCPDCGEMDMRVLFAKKYAAELKAQNLGLVKSKLEDEATITALRREVERLSECEEVASRMYAETRERIAELEAENIRVCKKSADYQARVFELEAAQRWVPVAEGPPDAGHVVLACYKNRQGKWRRIRAEYVRKHTKECEDVHNWEENCDEYKEVYYWPEGWYEVNDNHDEYGYIPVTEGAVTAWMPLPPAPGE